MLATVVTRVGGTHILVWTFGRHVIWSFASIFSRDISWNTMYFRVFCFSQHLCYTLHSSLGRVSNSFCWVLRGHVTSRCWMWQVASKYCCTCFNTASFLKQLPTDIARTQLDETRKDVPGTRYPGVLVSRGEWRLTAVFSLPSSCLNSIFSAAFFILLEFIWSSKYSTRSIFVGTSLSVKYVLMSLFMVILFYAVMWLCRLAEANKRTVKGETVKHCCCGVILNI